VRPDIILGHTPHPIGIGLAEDVVIYLSMYASVNEKGTKPPFPATELAWKLLRTDTSQDMLAKFHIYASLNPEKVAGKTFNVCDEDLTSWEVIVLEFGHIWVERSWA
jgi:hypothetical protein